MKKTTLNFGSKTMPSFYYSNNLISGMNIMSFTNLEGEICFSFLSTKEVDNKNWSEPKGTGFYSYSAGVFGSMDIENNQKLIFYVFTQRITHFISFIFSFDEGNTWGNLQQLPYRSEYAPSMDIAPYKNNKNSQFTLVWTEHTLLPTKPSRRINCKTIEIRNNSNIPQIYPVAEISNDQADFERVYQLENETTARGPFFVNISAQVWTDSIYGTVFWVGTDTDLRMNRIEIGIRDNFPDKNELVAQTYESYSGTKLTLPNESAKSITAFAGSFTIQGSQYLSQENQYTILWLGLDNRLNSLAFDNPEKVTYNETSLNAPNVFFNYNSRVSYLVWSGTDPNHSINFLEVGELRTDR